MDYSWIYGMTEEEYYLLKQIVEAEIAETIDSELRQAFPDWEPTEQEMDEMFDDWEAR